MKSLKRSEEGRFSDVILKYCAFWRKLSEVLAEIEANQDLADSIEAASKEKRSAQLGKVKL